MARQRVDQLLAGFADGDAISQEARFLQRTLRDLGIESGIYAPADRIAPDVRDLCRTHGEFDPRAADKVIYHYSIASSATDLFSSSPGRKIVRYHNITPAEFFAGFDDHVAEQLRDARAGLGSVAGEADVVWADSDYNAGEIRELGADHVIVVPLFFAIEEFAAEPDPDKLAKFAGPLKNILFMGRVAPNKCIEELIMAFAWYQKCINPYSRLILPGSERSCPRYFAMLRMLTERLDLPNVCFEGFVSNAGQSACYMSADVFVTTSRHEGYCLPLVEAMCQGVPVVARRTGGVPEAVGGAGVLFEDMAPRALAELIHRVASDDALREEVMRSQEKRVAEIRERDVSVECRDLLAG